MGNEKQNITLSSDFTENDGKLSLKRQKIYLNFPVWIYRRFRTPEIPVQWEWVCISWN